MNARQALVIAAQPTFAVGQPAATQRSAETTGNPLREISSASVTHVLTKTLTLNVGIGLVAMTIYTAGTGSVVAGGALTAGTMALGSVVYPVNEYLWDFYNPNTNLKANNEQFDAGASLWRNTGKWLTFKVGVASAKFAMIYAYTGSVVSMAVLGTGTSLALPAVYFLNNMTWDWYDWRAANQAGR